MIRRILHKKAEAYFTLEAAMILTIVTVVIVVLIYMMFFQYNRCLEDQDIGTVALRGCSVQMESKEELLQNLKSYAAQIDTKRYIAWEQGKINIELRENKVRVERTGSLHFPFAVIAPGNVRGEWKTESVFENRRISPVSFLRSYGKITGGR